MSKSHCYRASKLETCGLISEEIVQEQHWIHIALVELVCKTHVDT